ncbi:MAG: sugar phosphate isomerase/epimerase [Cyclobacteriaceae bacterium]|nr:sugar phosphate isomerase/epimerase [Cyclobacteriaceae bacterium]
MNRREFARNTGVGLSAIGLMGGQALYAGNNIPKEKKFLKSLKYSMVKTEGTMLDNFKLIKRLGFDGVELDSPNDFDRDEVIEASKKAKLPIPGVIDSVHWKDRLTDPDAGVRAKGLDGLKTAIKDAKAYGSSTVLLVPGRVTKEVAYDVAYKRSQDEIRKVLPMAEEYGVKIAIENVWNMFLFSPLEMARYIDELESDWVGAYFDVGNIVNYGWPEHWIRILGKRIIKVDIKEYSRAIRDKEGPSAGFRPKLGEGDCDWPEVVKALEEVGYNGWTSAEVRGGGEDRLREISQNMDKILGLV